MNKKDKFFLLFVSYWALIDIIGATAFGLSGFADHISPFTDLIFIGMLGIVAFTWPKKK